MECTNEHVGYSIMGSFLFCVGICIGLLFQFDRNIGKQSEIRNLRDLTDLYRIESEQYQRELTDVRNDAYRAIRLLSRHERRRIGASDSDSDAGIL